MENIKSTELYKQALNGNVSAQLEIAKKYDYNDLYEEAFPWYEKAAIGGNSDGMYALGYYYLYGRYVSKDIEKALFWFKKASAAGSYDAQRELIYNEDLSKNITKSEKIQYILAALKNPMLERREYDPEGTRRHLIDFIDFLRRN